MRQSSVKTTDVAVEDIPVLQPWLLTLLHTRLYPLLAAAYPLLADKTCIYDGKDAKGDNTEGGIGECRMRVHDAFIVRYSQIDNSLSLPRHCDTSALSFSIALNQRGVDYTGGGISIDALPGERGDHIFDAGK